MLMRPDSSVSSGALPGVATDTGTLNGFTAVRSRL